MLNRLLLFVVSLCFLDTAYAQKEEADYPAIKAQELLLKMATARESLVQFSVDATIDGGLGNPSIRSNNKGIKPESLEYHHEYSSVNKHRVFATRGYFEGVGWGGWDVSAVSGDFIMSTVNDKLVVSRFNRNRPPTPAGGFHVTLLDVRALGIGTYGDLRGAYPFEKTMSFLMENPNLSGIEAVFDKEEGGYVLEGKEGAIEMIVDPDKDYWPTSFKFAPLSTQIESVWSVSLHEVNEQWLPRRAMLTYQDKSNDFDERISIELRWSTVNEPIVVGLESCVRLAKRFGLQLDTSRVDKASAK